MLNFRDRSLRIISTVPERVGPTCTCMCCTCCTWCVYVLYVLCVRVVRVRVVRLRVVRVRVVCTCTMKQSCSTVLVETNSSIQIVKLFLLEAL